MWYIKFLASIVLRATLVRLKGVFEKIISFIFLVTIIELNGSGTDKKKAQLQVAYLQMFFNMFTIIANKS